MGACDKCGTEAAMDEIEHTQNSSYLIFLIHLYENRFEHCIIDEETRSLIEEGYTFMDCRSRFEKRACDLGTQELDIKLVSNERVAVIKYLNFED